MLQSVFIANGRSSSNASLIQSVTMSKVVFVQASREKRMKTTPEGFVTDKWLSKGLESAFSESSNSVTTLSLPNGRWSHWKCTASRFIAVHQVLEAHELHVVSDTKVFDVFTFIQLTCKDKRSIFKRTCTNKPERTGKARICYWIRL